MVVVSPPTSFFLLIIVLIKFFESEIIFQTNKQLNRIQN